jgi:PDZ domain-containing protein
VLSRLRHPRWLAALGAAAGLLFAAGHYHPPLLLIAPGPAVDITDDVTIAGVAAHPPTGRYIMTSVRLSRPTLLSIGLTGIWGQRELVPLNHVRGDREALYQRGREIFEASRLRAAAAAAQAAGFEVPVRDGRPQLPFTVSFRPRDVVGPSAGLAYALVISDMLAPGALGGGRTLAATGTIDGNGWVGLVSGIAEKALVARRAGSSVFVMPVDQLDGELHISVLGVTSLTDALDALRS